MSTATRAIGATIALGLLHVAARSRAARLRSLPDPHPLDALLREPEGEESFLERPDGTRLRLRVRDTRSSSPHGDGASPAGGSGPTVVLAHGYAATQLEWNVLWDLLGPGHRLITFDQRGHGGSTIGSDGVGSAQMAGDYRAILEHLDVRDGVLVGHSMGGFVSMAFLLNHPDTVRERLRGAVLVATFAGDVFRGAPMTRLQVPLIRSGLMKYVARSDTYGPLFAASLMGDSPFPSATAAFRRLYLEQRHDRLVPILEAFSREDMYPRLREIALPCVVVSGEADSTAPAWHARRIGEEIPGARSVVVPGKGHLLNWEAPESIADAIRSLVESGSRSG